MEPRQPLIEATETRWRWLCRCWGLREDVRALAVESKELTKERDAKHLFHVELEALKVKQTKLEGELQRTREGTRSLLRFIRVRHAPDIDLSRKPITNAELFS